MQLILIYCETFLEDRFKIMQKLIYEKQKCCIVITDALSNKLYSIYNI